MIELKSEINFNKHFKIFNIISIVLIILSVFFLLFKGLNYGVDFKGGTLIELRVQDQTINISSIRQSFKNMNLGDVNVKKFGNKTDFLIKFEKKDEKNINFINDIKNKLVLDIGNSFSFRRVENVGPKVSSELLKSGVIAILMSLSAMMIYIWLRFEWQFSLGAIIALVHDVIMHPERGNIMQLGYFKATESKAKNPAKRVYASLGLSVRDVLPYLYLFIHKANLWWYIAKANGLSFMTIFMIILKNFGKNEKIILIIT